MARPKQLNIRVSEEQYAVLEAIVRKSEFPTTPQTVASIMLKKLLNAKVAGRVR